MAENVCADNNVAERPKEKAVLLREKHKGQNALHGLYAQFHKENSKENKQ